jgi:Ser/Thr protein kinase RdoA (MazF antagonist)
MDSQVLTQVALLWGQEVSEFRLLGGFSDNVFALKFGCSDVVLKLTALSPEKSAALQGELAWVSYLADNGLRVARPIPSRQGNLLEEINDEGSSRLAVVWEKVKGTYVNIEDPRVWNQELFQRWGAVLGQLHNLARQAPAELALPHWHQGELFQKDITHLGQGISLRWQQYQNQLNALPVDFRGYGNIHNDLHHENFFIHEGNLWLYDFGDSEQNWYAYDIAVSLYHAVQASAEAPMRLEFARRFLDGFLAGYLKNSSLDHQWLQKIPWFLNWRQLYSYVYLTINLDQEKLRPQVRDALNRIRQRAEENQPFIDGLNL